MKISFVPMVPSGIFEMVAKTQAGFEEVLADEIAALGGLEIRIMRRAVAFSGDRALLYAANLWLRTALRVLVPIHATTAWNADELYAKARRINWGQYLTPRDTFAIDCTSSGELHHHSLFAALRVKDAIADQFMEKMRARPSVDLRQPTLRINLHIQDAEVVFALDSSGDSLHKRGYRTEKNEAPLNEVLAAGLIKLTGWDGKSNLGDLMCGSGTLLIEGANIAMNIAPGLRREFFGFQRWQDFDAPLWRRMREEAEARVHPPEGLVFGSDVDPGTLEIARRNIRRAGLDRVIELRCEDFRDARPPESGGMLIMNPPYGERLQVAEIEEFYAELGDELKKYCKGYQAWILSGNLDAVKRIGLKASKKIPVFNAAIECRFLKYELYDGSRDRKTPPKGAVALEMPES